MLKIDGHDDAFIGVVDMPGGITLTVYDVDKIVQTLTAMGMTEEDAVEYFEFNIRGAYVGPLTPLLLTRMSISDLDEMADALYDVENGHKDVDK